ncbi:MAG: radical SAM/SPASM domain-containing protein [Saprospiraceae bacterium]|nr:radical SAM/SPASM domain-containing protein [Saprospiraceae bacterium]
MVARSKLSDAFRFFRKLSLRKLWNWILVFSSFQVSRWTGKAIHWGRPVSLSIEPTTACNLRCPECPSGLRSFTRNTGNLKADLFRRTVHQVKDHLINLTFYFQGEPYINPDFLDMVHHAHESGIYTMTSTNGHFLSKENCRKTIQSGLDRLIISIDGAKQDTYEQYRREGTLQTVLEGAERLIRMKQRLGVRHPYVIFQMLVVRPNEEEIDDVYEIAREIGVDEVKLKTAQLYDYQNGHDLMPQQTRFSRYKRNEDGTFSPKNPLSNECWKLWHSGVITWDGLLVPCCFDKDADHVFGDLKENAMDQVWNGHEAQAFRDRIMAGRQHIDICSNCSEGCSVWA